MSKSIVFILALCLATSLALTNYKLPEDYSWKVANFLESLHSDSISKTDIIVFLSPILRGSVVKQNKDISWIAKNQRDGIVYYN